MALLLLQPNFPCRATHARSSFSSSADAWESNDDETFQKLAKSFVPLAIAGAGMGHKQMAAFPPAIRPHVPLPSLPYIFRSRRKRAFLRHNVVQGFAVDMRLRDFSLMITAGFLLGTHHMQGRH